MPEPSNGRADAARAHLNLIRSAPFTYFEDARLFVSLAFTYGLSVPEIVTESGFTVRVVRTLLLGAGA